MKTHPITHGLLAGLIFFTVVSENWLAAVAWTTAWVFVITHDITIARLTKSMWVASLFINAHNNKWPSARAEEEAARKLAEFEASQK